MSEHAPSYWAATAGPEPPGVTRLAGDRTAEVAVIGGGFTGLATAHRLAAVHGVDTVLLEGHRTGWGASGRNAGFAMIGLGSSRSRRRSVRGGPTPPAARCRSPSRRSTP